MTHANAPLSAEGRRRLIERCKTRPIAHVAAEMGISRACASKWVNRWRKHGDIRLLDRSSTPHHQPSATSADIAQRIEATRRECKWPASRITFELNDTGVMVSHRTVTRLLAHLGLHGRRFIDPDGDTNRKPRTIVAKRPGHMIHVDVKKVGRIPDGGGRRAHYNYHRPHGAASGKPPAAAVDRRCHQRHGRLIQPASARTLATAVSQDGRQHRRAGDTVLAQLGVLSLDAGPSPGRRPSPHIVSTPPGPTRTLTVRRSEQDGAAARKGRGLA